MTTTVADLLVRVRNILQDQDGVRWVDDELVRWVNDAQREIVLLKPDSYSTRATHSCAAGTLQTLPADGLQVLDVVRNMSGVKRAIRLVARYVLDAENPTWHSDTETTDIRVFAFDDRAPSAFYVYPPAQAGTQIEVLYSTAPTTVNIAGSLALNDIYLGAVVDYVCYRAFSKDAEYAQNSQRAESHYAKFVTSLGIKQQNEKAEGPNDRYNAAYIQRGTR